MSKQDETVNSESVVGQRLSKIQRSGGMFLVFRDRNIPIVSRITIGRGGPNIVELDDSLVSRYHAVIQKVGDDYFIEDLVSTNGTFVNGQRVPSGKYMLLHHGDVILVGRTRLSLNQLGI
jgi:pSer/pThr/pTyr-binding forkhead associated (FHA) protein